MGNSPFSRRTGRQTRLICVITHDILVFIHIEKSIQTQSKQIQASIVLSSQESKFGFLHYFQEYYDIYLELLLHLVDYSDFGSLGRLYRTLNNEFTQQCTGPQTERYIKYLESSFYVAGLGYQKRSTLVKPQNTNDL